MTPSLEGWPTKAKEAPSPHEVRLSPLDTNPVFHSLLKATTNLPAKSLSVFSMDEPYTNWSVHEKSKNIRSREEVPQLFEVGS